MNNYTTLEQEGYIISTDANKIETAVVHNYLSKESYWAKDIPFDVVERSIENSFCFGVYFNNKQIGFARLITDKATFAYLADVFIIDEHTGKGLSKWLIETIHAHPQLQNLRRWILATKDAHGLYKQFGWAKFTDEQVERSMQITNANVYAKSK